MKYLLFFIALLVAVGAISYYYFIHNPYLTHQPINTEGKVAYMTIKSTSFENNQEIPVKYTCDGENINPSLDFDNIPFGARSLVLIMEDPDSPNKNFTHWVMFNMQTTLTHIEDNFKSQDVAFGKNDFGDIGYGGPCPQNGNHRYVFKLYALDTILLLNQGASKADVLNNIKGHIMEESTLLGTYQRH